MPHIPGGAFAVQQERLYFLDNLKWFIIYLMVIFHGAMCYMAYAPDWWYVVDRTQPVFSATVFICWVDVFIMPVMFFISGYFGLMSLKRHGMGGFWRGKLSRIILPWVFGSMCLAPFITYLILLTRHSPMGFAEFYATLFWGPLYEQAHYWYLGALTALYLLLCLAARLWPGLLKNTAPASPSPLLLFLAFLASAGSIALLGSYMHPDTWTFYGYILVLQPVRIPTYIIIFALGILACRQQWFSPEGYSPSPGKWCLPFLLASLFYLYQKLFLSGLGVSPGNLALCNGLAQGAFTFAALFFLLGCFRRYAGGTSPLLASLAKTSYGVYYIHQPILFPVVWAFTALSLNVYLKYSLACLISLALCYMLSRYLLLRLPCFGGRR